MDRGGPEPLQRLTMLRCAVALVRGEPVSGILAVQRFHHAVALGLRNDRGGGDREVDAVALVEHVLRHVDARHGPRVDEHVLRLPRQRFDRAPHREQTGVINVDGVDFLDRGNADADARRFCPYFQRKLCPRGRVEFLGIINARDIGFRREHDGGGHHRPCKWPHADFVDTGDVLHARFPQQLLEMPHRLQAQTLVPLSLVALLQRNVELSHALPRIALQTVQDSRRNELAFVEIPLTDLVDRKLVNISRHPFDPPRAARTRAVGSARRSDLRRLATSADGAAARA